MRSTHHRHAGLLAALGITSAIYAATRPPLKWIKPPLTSLPAARCSAAMVYDPQMHATLLYGGTTYGNLYGDTWAFTKTNGWTQLSPATSPPPLQGAAMAYDPVTKTVVLFGGTLNRIPGGSGKNSDQTWTWDGTTWTRQHPHVSPPARGWNATNGMVFDAKLGKVVLFGGATDEFVMFNDTWEWDALRKTWAQQFPAHSPSPRVTTLAYDETAQEVMVFGGWTNGTPYNDTWTYDGTDWLQQQPFNSPQPRADNGLAFDPILHEVVLFGGLAGACEDCGQGRLNDTWLWDGGNWTQVPTSLSTPRPRSGISFAYDGTTGTMLVFGGWVTDSQFTNTTWLFKAF